jgi:hypothetical protein
MIIEKNLYMNFSRFLKNKLLLESYEKPIHLSIMNDDVRKTFSDLSSLLKNKNCAVIGGLSVGKYTQPRSTVDIDLLTISEEEISDIEKEIKSKFRKIRDHAFEHKVTGVEVEILTPEFLKINKDLVYDAIKNSIDDNGINVVNPKYLIALKLSRAADKTNIKSHMDKFDIIGLLQKYGKIDISNLNLKQKEIDLYNELYKESTKVK